ncbi:MAG: hypothetical protein ACRDT9_06870 [Agromyces sp.]
MAITTTHDVVDLIPVDTGLWRVCDTRFEEGRSRRIIGYLDHRGEGYEMLWMRPRPGVIRRYATFDDAVRAVRIRLEHTA